MLCLEFVPDTEVILDRLCWGLHQLKGMTILCFLSSAPTLPTLGEKVYVFYLFTFLSLFLTSIIATVLIPTVVFLSPNIHLNVRHISRLLIHICRFSLSLVCKPLQQMLPFLIWIGKISFFSSPRSQHVWICRQDNLGCWTVNVTVAC